MGASFVSHTFDCKREDLNKIFHDWVSESKYENGHGGYSGTAAEFRGLSIEDRSAFPTIDQAERWLADNTEKWEDAIAVPVAQGKETASSLKKREKLKKEFDKIASKRAALKDKIISDFNKTKSKMIGCKRCGSRLNKAHVRASLSYDPKCICGATLYNSTAQDRLAKLTAKMEKARKEAQEFTPTYENSRTIWCIGGWASC